MFTDSSHALQFGGQFVVGVLIATVAHAFMLNHDAEFDSRNYCPPLTSDGEMLVRMNSTALCEPIFNYNQLRHFHASAVRWLWLAAVYTPTNNTAACGSSETRCPSEWEALYEVVETASRLDCFVAFSTCYPSMKDFTAKIDTMCETFRNRFHRIAWVFDEEEPGMAQNIIFRHLCFGTDVLGANTPVSDEQIRTVASGRALRSLQKPKPENSPQKLPRWVFLPEDEDAADAKSNHICSQHVGSSGVGLSNGQPNPRATSATKVRLQPSWWSTPSISHMLSTIGRGFGEVNRHGLFVNLGARSGTCGPEGVDYMPGSDAGDPANCLAAASHPGVVLDGDESQFSSLRKLFNDRHDVELLLGWFDPLTAQDSISTALKRLRNRSHVNVMGSDDVDLLKVDVDNCDCCFVETLLDGGLRPRIIHAEIHSLIPPPIAFKPKLRQDLHRAILSTSQGMIHLHCSLSAYIEMLEPRGFWLSHLESRDAVFVRKDVAHLFPWVSCGDSGAIAWRQGNRCHPGRPLNHEEHEYNALFWYDFRRWEDERLEPQERQSAIETHLQSVGLRGYRLWLHDPSTGGYLNKCDE